MFFMELLFIIFLLVVAPGPTIFFLMLITFFGIGFTLQSMQNDKKKEEEYLNQYLEDYIAKYVEEYESLEELLEAAEAEEYQLRHVKKGVTTVDNQEGCTELEIEEMFIEGNTLTIIDEEDQELSFDIREDLYVTIDGNHVIHSLYNHLNTTFVIDKVKIKPERIVTTPLGIFLIDDNTTFYSNSAYKTEEKGRKTILTSQYSRIIEKQFLDDKGIPFSVEQLGVLYTNEAYDLKYKEVDNGGN